MGRDLKVPLLVVTFLEQLWPMWISRICRTRGRVAEVDDRIDATGLG